MSSILSVYVYGNGDLFRECFNAIAATMGAADFSSVTKLSVLFAGIWCICNYIQTQSLMVFLKWMLVYLFVMDGLFLPTNSVEIIDQTNPGAVYEVDNVPKGIALLAYWTTSIGADLTELVDETFSMPDYQAYSDTGMAMASRLVKAATQFQITDPVVNNNLEQFIQGCVNYDLMLGKYTLKDLMATDNLWSFVSEHASPANAFIYNSVVTTCKDGANALSADWSNQISEAESEYGARLYPALTQAEAKQELIKRLPMSYNFLMNLSKSTNDLIQQNIMANMLQQGIVQMGAGANTSAALIAYSDARAEEHIRLQMQTLGSIAADWLPLFRNVLEVILLGCFIFVVPMALMPIGFSLLKNYALTLLWLQLWGPLFSVVNLGVSFYAKGESSAAVAGGALTLVNYSGIALINSDIISAAGYCSILVPALAYGVLTGFSKSMMSMTQYLGSALQSGTSTAVNESASGNYSFGNTNFDTHNQNLQTANHIDTGGKIMTGGITRSLNNGAAMTVNQDGSIVMDSSGSISRLGTSINLADSVHATATHQYEDALNHSKSSAHASVSEYTNAIKNLYEYADSKQHSNTTNISDTATKSNALTVAASKVHEVVDAYAKEHQISTVDATRSIASKYFEQQASAKLDTNRSVIGKFVGLTFGASGDGSVGGGHRNESSDSHEKVTTDNASLSNRTSDQSNLSATLDSALRYSHDQSHQISNDSTQRVSQSFAKSMDHANSLREESVEQFQQSQSYQHVASMSQEHAATINANADQEFMTWLSRQPSTPGQKSMGVYAAESMSVNDPVQAQYFAQQFVREKTDGYMQQFKEEHRLNN